MKTSTVGTAVRRRRLQLRLTQRELADRAQIQESTVRNIETGRSGANRQPHSWRHLATALGWDPDTSYTTITSGSLDPGADMVLDGPGGQPTGVQIKSYSAQTQHLPPRIRAELAERWLLDYQVLDLTAVGDDHRILVLWTAPGPPPDDIDELRDQFQVWSRIQRKLHGISEAGEPR